MYIVGVVCSGMKDKSPGGRSKDYGGVMYNILPPPCQHRPKARSLNKPTGDATYTKNSHGQEALQFENSQS